MTVDAVRSDIVLLQFAVTIYTRNYWRTMPGDKLQYLLPVFCDELNPILIGGVLGQVVVVYLYFETSGS